MVLQQSGAAVTLAGKHEAKLAIARRLGSAASHPPVHPLANAEAAFEQAQVPGVLKVLLDMRGK
jgi:hypothetical protein